MTTLVNSSNEQPTITAQLIRNISTASTTEGTTKQTIRMVSSSKIEGRVSLTYSPKELYQGMASTKV